MTIQDIPVSAEQWQLFWGKHPEEAAKLAELEYNIGYHFNNRHLLYEGMTHRSALTHMPQDPLLPPLPWNERLEFLGDSVLGLVVSTMIWHRQRLDEGQLSQRKASLVSETSLAKLARELGVEQCLTVGKVEKKAGSHLRPSLLADALEALIGGIYLDSSYATVQSVVQKWFDDFFSLDADDIQDAKTRLQERIQAQYQQVPHYVTLEESGPDHSKTFRVAVIFDGKMLAEAEGTSKKRASQAAAKKVLVNWMNKPSIEGLKSC